MCKELLKITFVVVQLCLLLRNYILCLNGKLNSSNISTEN